MAKVGRPSGLTEEVIKQAEKLCELGATDAEIADFFDVSSRTILRWKASSEPFCRALKAGKELADERVKRSLYHRALGFEHDDVDIRVVQGAIVQTKVRKYFPPDTVACIFWLKNRDPENWREKRDGNEDATPEEAAEIAQQAVQKAMSTSGN